MLRIGTRTKLTPEEAIGRAVEFFGPGGLGLAIKDQAPTCVYFEGGGGRVEVVTCADEEGTSVDLVSQEWDQPAKEFMGKVAR